jgi:phage gp29-like protein
MKFTDLLGFLRQRTRVDNSREQPSMASEIDANVLYNAITMAEQQGRTRELFSLYRDMLVSDGHAQSEFAKRKLAVINEPFIVLPFDKKNAQDIQTAQAIESAMEDVEDVVRAWSHLLDSSLYPVSVVEKVFSVNASGQFRLDRLVPVPHTLLDFQSGGLKIRDGLDPENIAKATIADPDHYIIHRGNLMSLPDQWGGPMRSVLFWWLLSTCNRGWWSRFLEKYGAPFIVGKYDPNDDASKTILDRAFRSCCRLGGLVVTKDTEIDLMQAASKDTGDAFGAFHDVCNREKSKIVIGQTLSAEASALGLGGTGAATTQETVRADIRRFDALALSTSIRKNLFTQICRINRLPGRVPKAQFGTLQNQAQADTMATILQKFKAAGIEVDDSGFSDLSDMTGTPLRRAIYSGPITPFSATTIQTSTIDSVSQHGATDLARAFRGSHAEIARIVRESKTQSECRSRLESFCASLRPGEAAKLIEAGLVSYAANGVVLPFSAHRQ